MNKFRWQCIFAAFFSVCSFVTSNAATHRLPPIPVSMIWLLVTPEAYAGKDVSVGGYLSLEMEDHRIYLDCASYRYREKRNSIGIAALGTSNFFKFRLAQGLYVKVSGRFEPNPRYGKSPTNGATAGWINVDVNSIGVADIFKPQPRAGVTKNDLCAGSKPVERARSPEVIVHVNLSPMNRDKFIGTLRDFAEQQGFKITKRHVWPDASSERAIDKIFSRKDGIEIAALGGIDTTAEPGLNLYIYVFTQHEKIEWQPVAKHLVATLRKKWPKITEIKYWKGQPPGKSKSRKPPAH